MRESTTEPIAGLNYVKITVDFAVELLDRDIYPTDAAAGKYVIRYLETFFFGDSNVSLPRKLEKKFGYQCEKEIKKYRQAVLNGAKNRSQPDPQPAETQNLGTTDPKTDPQTTIDNSTESTSHIPHCSVYGCETQPRFVFENPPSLDEVFEYAEQEEMLGQLIDAIPSWYEHHQRNGWLNQRGEPIRAEVMEKDTGEVLAGWMLFLRKFNAKVARDVGLPADYWKALPQPASTPTPEQVPLATKPQPTPSPTTLPSTSVQTPHRLAGIRKSDLPPFEEYSGKRKDGKCPKCGCSARMLYRNPNLLSVWCCGHDALEIDVTQLE